MKLFHIFKTPDLIIELEWHSLRLFLTVSSTGEDINIFFICYSVFVSMVSIFLFIKISLYLLKSLIYFLYKTLFSLE